MTFSANPARTSLRERLRRQTASQRAFSTLFLTALGLLLGGMLLSLVLVRAVVHEQATQLGAALAADAAERAAEYLVHNDLVSLNVITGSLSRQASVVGVVIYDRYRLPLAQSGLVQATPDTLVVRADILTEEQELRGTVEILMEPRAPLAALARLDYALFGWFGFAAVLLLVVTRIQRATLEEQALVATPVVAPAVPTPATEEEPAAPSPAAVEAALPADSVVLRIHAVNLATLQQRLSPRALAELVALYAEMLARACALYQGEVTRPLEQEAMVTFRLEGASEEDVLFRAICCAQLFFGVVRETNTARRELGKTAMQFSAALHRDPVLAADDTAYVTWEICTQAGTAGRLTVTDTISDLPVLGERLVLDGGHRHVLQIELPGSENLAPRLQDVLALGVLRMADPYEELISRQIKRLVQPAAA